MLTFEIKMFFFDFEIFIEIQKINKDSTKFRKIKIENVKRKIKNSELQNPKFIETQN